MAGIELQGDANLTLVVDGTFTVTGGKAGDGGDQRTGGTGAVGGVKGYAGIAVPTGTTLTIRGTGAVLARGGDAGRGGDSLPYQGRDNGWPSGAGGGGAGAGIGGNGGTGARTDTGNKTLKYTLNTDKDGKTSGTYAFFEYYWMPESEGYPGGSAGTINIYDTVAVTAYGGGGGAGGVDSTMDSGGGGGYPAAGIGGGGAGGGGSNDGYAGGGGFSGGHGDSLQGYSIGVETVRAHDGLSPLYAEFATTRGWPHAGGYFRAGDAGRQLDQFKGGFIGGGTGWPLFGGTKDGKKYGYYFASANGGTGGSGGTVKVASTAVQNLTVANGSYTTRQKQTWGQNPTPIYAQSGYSLDTIRNAGITNIAARTKGSLETELKSLSKAIPAAKLAGVGSGAGYTETSNGSYAKYGLRPLIRKKILIIS